MDTATAISTGMGICYHGAIFTFTSRATETQSKKQQHSQGIEQQMCQVFIVYHYFQYG
jgi:hypothetical protein